MSNLIFRRIASYPTNYEIVRPDQEPHHRNLEKSDNRKLQEIAEENVMPELVKSGPIALSLRSNSARSNTLSQLQDFTNGILRNGQNGSRNLHGYRNSDGLRDEIEGWKHGRCNKPSLLAP